MILLLISSLLLFACSTENNSVAGGEDFPNTIQALKGDLFESLNENAQRSGPAQENPFSVEDDPATAPAASRLLPEALAEPDTLISLRDTAQGFVLIVIQTPQVFGTDLDSLWIKWNEKVTDNIPDNEEAFQFHSYKNTALGTLRYTKIRSTSPEKTIFITEPFAELFLTEGVIKGQWQTENIMTVGAGPDGLFEGAGEKDNEILAIRQRKFLGGQLVEEKQFSDLDGDGKILSSKDSNLVLIKEFSNKLEGLNDSLSNYRNYQELSLWAKGGDTTAHQLAGFYQEQEILGTWKTTSANRARERQLQTGDTLEVFEHFYTDKVGGNLRKKVRYLNIIDIENIDLSNITLLELERFDKEGIGRFYIQLQPEKPLQNGEEFSNGTLLWEVLTKEEKKYQLTAIVNEGRIQGTLIEGENQWEVDWAQ